MESDLFEGVSEMERAQFLGNMMHWMRHVYAAKPHVVRNLLHRLSHKESPSGVHVDPRKNELKKEEKPKEAAAQKPKPAASE